MSPKQDTPDRLRQQVMERFPNATPEKINEITEAVRLTVELLRGNTTPYDKGLVSESESHHRLEVLLTGGMTGEITFKGVCDAPINTDCRMWCEFDLCSEGYQDGHEHHTLFDQGECNLISYLNGDPSMIPELYDGPEVPLRSGTIEVAWDCDGVVWCYADLVYAYSSEETLIPADHWFYQSGDTWMAVGPGESVEEWFSDLEAPFESWMIQPISKIPQGVCHWRDGSGADRQDGLSLSTSERIELFEYRRIYAGESIEPAGPFQTPKLYALFSDQGTAMSETVLTEAEFTPENQRHIKANAPADWDSGDFHDVSWNDALNDAVRP